MSDFPSPLPLAPVNDRTLDRLRDIARDARDGITTEEAAIFLIHAAPELLDELARYRRAIGTIRGRVARMMRRRGTPSVTLAAISDPPEIAA